MLNKKILERWAKDYSLPIKIFTEPTFSYLIELYDDLYGTKEKLQLLEETVSKFENEMEFLEEYSKIKDNIIESLKSNDKYKEFNTGDLSKFNVSSNFPKTDIFKNNNSGKYFLSIDLAKANYQALKYISPEIVLNTKTYSEFISLFTDLEYMSKSKYLRQVIFGNLNPKRQSKIERYLIEQILQFVLGSDKFVVKHLKEQNIRMVSTDEIIFELSKEEAEILSSLTYELIFLIKDELDIDVDVEVFQLKDILCKCFAKEFKHKEGYEFKAVPQLFYPQIYKVYNGLEIVDKDLMFYHEHRLAKFLEPIA